MPNRLYSDMRFLLVVAGLILVSLTIAILVSDSHHSESRVDRTRIHEELQLHRRSIDRLEAEVARLKTSTSTAPNP